MAELLKNVGHFELGHFNMTRRVQYAEKELDQEDNSLEDRGSCVQS